MNSNVLDSSRSCNNEQLKMQRLGMEKLTQMRGIEYVLFAAKEPDLYVIRKQKRESPSSAIPQTTYYIIKGTVYQSPNLFSVLASRTVSKTTYLLNLIHYAVDQESLSRTKVFQGGI